MVAVGVVFANVMTCLFLQMVDQNMDEDSQSVLPAEENVSKPEGLEKESTQVQFCLYINKIYL